MFAQSQSKIKPFSLEGSEIVRKRLVPQAKVPPGMLTFDENDDEVDLNSSDLSSVDLDEDGESVNFLGEPTINQIVEREMERRRSQSSQGLSLSFSYQEFQKALRINWDIMALKRLEKLVRGEAVPTVPEELADLDFEAQLQRLYGPMEREDKKFPHLVQQLWTTRLEMIIDMVEKENELIR